MDTLPGTQSGPEAGNLARTLIFLVAWRQCSACGARVLYVDEHARTLSAFHCGRCESRRERLTAQCRPRRPSLPMRAAMHLWGLFATSNDNHHEARA